MKIVKTVDELRAVLYRITMLRKIQRQLHYISECACNTGLSSIQEKREVRLLKDADELAATMGLRAYYQGDPRGCALYLVESNKGADTNYTDGIACCD